MNSWFWITTVLVTFVLVAYSFVKISNSRDWMSAHGRVVSAAIEPIHKNNTQQSVADNSFNYKVDIRYEYSVDGEIFKGHQLSVGLSNVVTNKNDADDLIAKYPPNSPAVIYYDPLSPSQSALITGKSVPVMGFVMVGLMIIAISAVIGFIVKSGILN
jgi:hypothetical protein